MSGEKTTERVRFLREAGVVPRCHTFGCPDPSHTVGLHSWNVVNLLLVLHPEPSLELVKACQWHDAPERLLGDTPAPVKWRSRMIREELRRLETEIHEQFGTTTTLTSDELRWLIALDVLELLLMGQERRALGDYRFLQLVTVAGAWFASNTVPIQIARFLEMYQHGLRGLDTLPGETK